jgi:Na+/proline symporter
VAIIAVVYTMVLTGQNMAAVGRLINYIEGGKLHTSTQATVIAAVVLIAYTAMGGLYAEVWTDLVQFLIMLIVIGIVAPIMAVSVSGGSAPIAANLEAGGLSLFNPTVSNPLWPSFTFAFLMFLGVPGDPTSPQRALAARDSSVAKKSFVLAGFSVLWWGVALTLIGAATHYLMPDIASEWGTSEAALPIFAIKYFPPVVTGLAFAAMIAAIMSTADSMLLLCTTHLVYDIAMQLVPDRLPEKKVVKILPWITVVVGIFALFIALRISSLLATLYFVFSLVGAAFIIPTLVQLYFPDKCTAVGVTSSVLLGGIVTVVMYQTGVMGLGGDPIYTGMFVSALCVILGSFFKSSSRDVR